MSKRKTANTNATGPMEQPSSGGRQRKYRAPVLRSTEAFEKLALQSCGELSETPDDECDEL